MSGCAAGSPTIQGKNSSQFHISTAPYDDLKDVLDTYYGCFDDEDKTEMLALNEQKYLGGAHMRIS